MIIEKIGKIKSGKKELRQFGISFGIVLGLLGGLLFWRGKENFIFVFSLSALFLLLGLILPNLLMPLQKIWMTLVLLLNWLMTKILFFILFYLVITPIGLFARFLGKDFLDTQPGGKTNSYWIRKQTVRKKKNDFERQF